MIPSRIGMMRSHVSDVGGAFLKGRRPSYERLVTLDRMTPLVDVYTETYFPIPYSSTKSKHEVALRCVLSVQVALRIAM